jgi:hypothetical protein
MIDGSTDLTQVRGKATSMMSHCAAGVLLGYGLLKPVFPCFHQSNFKL